MHDVPASPFYIVPINLFVCFKRKCKQTSPAHTTHTLNPLLTYPPTAVRFGSRETDGQRELGQNRENTKKNVMSNPPKFVAFTLLKRMIHQHFCEIMY